MGGGARRCDSLWQGEGRSRACDVTLIKIFYHTCETWNLKRCLTFCCNRCILTEGERTKTTPDKTFQTKDHLTKPPDKPPRTIEREFAQGVFVRYFCTRPTKNGGFEMCDVLWGVPGCVTKVWLGDGGGQKLAKNSVTYFMDGPYPASPLALSQQLFH